MSITARRRWWTVCCARAARCERTSRCRTAPWIVASSNASVASRSSPSAPRSTGAACASTSSTPPATWTSAVRSNECSAWSTACSSWWTRQKARCLRPGSWWTRRSASVYGRSSRSARWIAPMPGPRPYTKRSSICSTLWEPPTRNSTFQSCTARRATAGPRLTRLSPGPT